jgi:DNA repair protein RadC
MICAHNHPSGHLTPSQEDRDITKTLVEAGKLLQIRLLDHLIIGNGRYFSFADEGLL